MQEEGHYPGHIATWFAEDLKEMDVLNRIHVPDVWAHDWSTWFGGRATITNNTRVNSWWTGYDYY